MSKLTTKQTIALYWQHVRKYPLYVSVLMVLIPFATLFSNFLPPLILANVLTRLSEHDFIPNQIWDSFGLSLITYTAILMFGSLVIWRILDIFVWKLEANVQRDMAQRIFNHLLSQSANFHANRFGGSLVSHTNKLMGSYIRFADTTIFQTFPLIWSVVIISIILYNRAGLFVLVLILFSIAYVTSSFLVTRKVRRLSALQATAESKQTGYLADAITNVMAIKSFAGQQFENREFAKITMKTRKRTHNLMRGSQPQMIYFGGLGNLISGLSLFMAVISVMVFKANVATVFLIFNYTANIVSQLWVFSVQSIRQYNRALGDASDMVKDLQIEPEIQDPEDPEPSRISKGEIQFNSVDFTHLDAGETLFHDLNLRINPGEKVGLVGHSGSGKTTFTRLLLRFSDIDGGEILIDGQNIAAITQDDLRRKIAYVPQEPIMFHRTLMENICYGDQAAGKEAAIKAAKVAHAHEFIQKLPDGYETLVGERGVKLSGGQRQRIAIARAMLKNASILVLDEATSALDSESEKLIQDALWKLMEGRTAIVIAHRLSTVQKMDRIVVMEDGDIVEQGTHAQLIKNKGVYSELWEHQSGGFFED